MTRIDTSAATLQLRSIGAVLDPERACGPPVSVMRAWADGANIGIVGLDTSTSAAWASWRRSIRRAPAVSDVALALKSVEGEMPTFRRDHTLLRPNLKPVSSPLLIEDAFDRTNPSEYVLFPTSGIPL